MEGVHIYPIGLELHHLIDFDKFGCVQKVRSSFNENVVACSLGLGGNALTCILKL